MLLRPREKAPALERVLGDIARTVAGIGIQGAMTEYQTDLLGFAQEILNVHRKTLAWSEAGGPEALDYKNHVWDGTVDPFIVATHAIEQWESVGMESGTATGKTFWLAIVVLWFLACFEESMVVTVAPKAGLLRANLWKEITRLWPAFSARFPKAQLLDMEIRMDPDRPKLWKATAFPIGVAANEELAQKAKGFHERDMLIIFEETPGIPMAVLTAFEETCRAPHNLRIAVGNPDHQGDNLHRFCEDKHVVNVRLSCLDHPNLVMNQPNFIPGAAARQSVERTGEKYGIKSRIYLSQVRGISPAEDKDSLISMAWLGRAASKSHEELRLLAQGDWALGVDVANSRQGDRGVIVRGKGGVLMSVRPRKMDDLAYNANHLAIDVAADIHTYSIPSSAVGVDSVGLGVATLNKLLELGFKVQGLNGGSKAPRLPGAETFFDLRAAMYWKLREDLRLDRIALPDNRDLFNELTLVRWMTHNRTIRVEEKKALRKRLGASPDLADAVVYWNWAREFRGIATGSTDFSGVTF